MEVFMFIALLIMLALTGWYINFAIKKGLYKKPEISSKGIEITLTDSVMDDNLSLNVSFIRYVQGCIYVTPINTKQIDENFVEYIYSNIYKIKKDVIVEYKTPTK